MLFNKIKDSINKFSNNLEENVKSKFTNNVLQILGTSLIFVSYLTTQANAIDLNVSIKSGSERVHNPNELGMYLALNSIKNFDEKFLIDNKVTPDNIYQMSKINLIQSNAYEDKSPRQAIKAYNLQKELLQNIESNKNNKQDILTKIYVLSMGNILLDKELSYENKISLLDDKLDEFEDMIENNKINTNQITFEQIENMKLKSNNIISNVLNSQFTNPEILSIMEQIKMFAEIFKIDDKRLSILDEKEKTMILTIIEKNYNSIIVLENKYLEENKEIIVKDNNSNENNILSLN